jgi:hypothetical protein
VVSSDIPEVRYLEACRVGADHDGVLAQIDAALVDPTPRRQRAAAMQMQSWETRLGEIGHHLEELENREQTFRLRDFPDWRSIWTAPPVRLRKGA